MLPAFNCASASRMSGTRNVTWWTPGPRLSMYFAIAESLVDVTDLPRRALALPPRVQQQRDHPPRVVRRPAHPVSPVGRHERRHVQRPGRLDELESRVV